VALSHSRFCSIKMSAERSRVGQAQKKTSLSQKIRESPPPRHCLNSGDMNTRVSGALCGRRSEGTAFASCAARRTQGTSGKK